MTIRHKKIPRPEHGGGPAAEIAEEISKKAFEHLIPQHERKLDALAIDGYRYVLSKVGVTEDLVKKMAEAGLVWLSNVIRVDFVDAHGNEVTVVVTTENDEDKYLSYSHSITVQNSAFYDEVVGIRAVLDPLHRQRNDLREAIYDQIAGRSTKEVMAEWPEAAHIVAEIMKLAPPPPMIRPLDALLSKFLPMLPAPK